jgi:hypothetical protein
MSDKVRKAITKRLEKTSLANQPAEPKVEKPKETAKETGGAQG